MVELFANSGDPDQMPRSATSDLGLHCFPVTCLGVSSLKWVKPFSDVRRGLVCKKQTESHNVVSLVKKGEKSTVYVQFP